MLPLTKEKPKSHQDPRDCGISGKSLKKLSKSINYQKFRDHCHYTGKYRGAAHSNCNLKFNVSNEIPPVSHNVSNFDYLFHYKRISK